MTIAMITRKFFGCLAALSLAVATAAYAQGTVQQSGPVTPFDGSVWFGNGVLADGGTPATPYQKSLGLFNGPACPFGISSQGAPGVNTSPAGTFSICQTATTTTFVVIGVNGQPTPNLQVSIGGTIYPFPGPGTGNVVGPSSSILGDLACFNSTTGTLLVDCGTAPAPSITSGAIGSTVIPASISAFTTTGYSVAGDGGSALWAAGTGCPATGKVVSANGRCFVVADNSIFSAQYGSTSTTTLAAATLTAALSAIPVGSDLYSSVSVDVGTTPVVNPGVEITSHQPVYYLPSVSGSLIPSGGYEVQNLPGRDWSRDSFGQEYFTPLFLWGVSTTVSSPLVILMTGDSNSINAGTVGPELQALLSNVNAVGTVVNCAVGGTTEDQWVNATGPFATGQADASCSMTALLTTYSSGSPFHLWINGYGCTNDPALISTTHTYSTDPLTNCLDAKIVGITAVRTAYGNSPTLPGIITMTAAFENDGLTNAGTSDHRDELFNYQANIGLRQVAETYGTAFFDKNSVLSDAFVDFTSAAGAFQNHNLDNNRVHTQYAATDILAHRIFDFIVPPVYQTTIKTLGAASVAASTYPLGLHMGRALDTTNSWPVDGFQVSMIPSYQADNFGLQFDFDDTATNSVYARTASSSGWGTFVQFLGPNGVQSQTFTGTGVLNGTCHNQNGLFYVFCEPNPSTYATIVPVAGFQANDASPFSLQLYLTGAASEANRIFLLQSGVEGSSNDGNLDLQGAGGKLGLCGVAGVPAAGVEVGCVTQFDATIGIPQATWTDTQACTAGQISVDASFVYVCTAANTVKRVAVSSF